MKKMITLLASVSAIFASESENYAFVVRPVVGKQMVIENTNGEIRSTMLSSVTDSGIQNVIQTVGSNFSMLVSTKKKDNSAFCVATTICVLPSTRKEDFVKMLSGYGDLEELQPNLPAQVLLEIMDVDYSNSMIRQIRINHPSPLQRS